MKKTMLTVKINLLYNNIDFKEGMVYLIYLDNVAASFVEDEVLDVFL